MGDLLNNDTGLVVFFVPESDESSKDVFKESSDDDKEEESDEISIYFCAVWARSCYFVCSIADFAAC